MSSTRSHDRVTANNQDVTSSNEGFHYSFKKHPFFYIDRSLPPKLLTHSFKFRHEENCRDYFSNKWPNKLKPLTYKSNCLCSDESWLQRQLQRLDYTTMKKLPPILVSAPERIPHPLYQVNTDSQTVHILSHTNPADTERKQSDNKRREITHTTHLIKEEPNTSSIEKEYTPQLNREETDYESIETISTRNNLNLEEYFINEDNREHMC